METYISDVKVEVKGVGGIDVEVECGKEGKEERRRCMQLLHVNGSCSERSVDKR